MYSPRVKRGVFWLEGINSLATTYYFYFLFFFLKRQFGFDDFRNLLWAALLGLVLMLAPLAGGRHGQRRGYFPALRLGYGLMAVALAIGAVLDSPLGHLGVMAVAACGMCFTWPNLEALVAEQEPADRLARNLGIYNLIWSGGNAVGYFTGGALLEYGGPRSIFLVPAALHLLQWFLVRHVASMATGPRLAGMVVAPLSSARERRRSPVSPRTFLRMAWVANPFAYVAINTAVPLIPFLAGRLHLTPAAAGMVCSVWFFARTAAFGLLWWWTGWHYRFRWLLAAYAAMAVGFAALVQAPDLPRLLGAQVVFGLGLGLVYYSSLFYSMDVGETKGEHGGWHEAAIGAGIFAGPAAGVVGFLLRPGDPQAGIRAVGLLLGVGFLALLVLRWPIRRRREES